MLSLHESLLNTFFNKEVFEEYSILEGQDVIAINESFQSSLLVNLANRIKDAEKEHAEYDKKQAQRYKEEGRSYTPSKTAKSFASIFGPLTDTPRWGESKTGIQGLKWSEIKDDDFKQYKGDDKAYVKFLKSVYAKKAMADIIVCIPGTKDIVAFIKGYAKTLGDVRVYHFPTKGWKTGVQEKTAPKYKYDERSLKVNEALELFGDFDVYVLEITDSMIETYKNLHKERTESQKGVIEMDKDSLEHLLKQQQSRYNTLVKKMKAEKLKSNVNELFDEIKKTNDEVVELFKKVMAKPENMDQRFDLSDLMRYVSYAYEQFYKSMSYKRSAERSVERAKAKGVERPTVYGEWDREASDEYIRDAKEYIEKVKKEIKKIEDNLK
jgi:hypothetical protein